MNGNGLQAAWAWSRIAAAAGFFAAVVCAPSFGAQAKQATAASVRSGACTVQATNYDGWKAEELRNRWVKLIIVPQLGGRLMQVTFNGHDYLFVNDELKGQVNGPDTEHHRWYNYGGDKIWPMPEGSQDEQHWAGAGGALLDEGAFSLRVLARGSECAVRLTGPDDPQIGQQYIRDIRIGTDSPVISFHAVMKNVSGYPQTWSEQSVSQYNAAAPGDSSQFNPKFWGVTPTNSSSVFPNGYHIRNGDPDNPSYTVGDGLFKAQYTGHGGEVWVDSPAGWLAVVDGSTGYTMVERRHYDPKADYPGQTTMLFFTTGQHRRRPAPGENGAAPPAPGASGAGSFGQGPVAGQTARLPIYYMEAEVNSPMVELAPGESYAMDTNWYPTRMGEDFKTTTYSGVVGAPLEATATPSGLTLSGKFGVFYAGSLVAHYYDRSGLALGIAKLMDVTPFDPVNLQTTVQAPPDTYRVSVHLVEKPNVDRGPLGEALVNPPPPAPARRYDGN
jgi:hypothetical protein